MTVAAVTRVDACRLCGTPVEQERRPGRPRAFCAECGEKQRAYREANKDEIAEKQRAYYEKRKRGGLKTITCTNCGERLAHRTPDGLCGFCRQGIPA